MPQLDSIYFALSRGGGSLNAPVILIHGLGSSHLVWPDVLRRMESQTVYTLDLPGHGKSGGTGLQSVSAYAKAVWKFLDAAGIYSAILIGHSLGAAIALETARHDPDRVSGLGLLSAGSLFHCSKQSLESIKNPAMLADALTWLSANLFASGAHKKLQSRVVDALRQARPAVLAADLRACSRYEFTPLPEKCSMPVLAIHGSEDRIVLRQDAQHLAHSIPGARLVNIPSAGHMVMLEAPERVGYLLTRFVRQVNTREKG
ncbi:MAG: alpha/beta fold hydrolase [bacterium]